MAFKRSASRLKSKICTISRLNSIFHASCCYVVLWSVPVQLALIIAHSVDTDLQHINSIDDCFIAGSPYQGQLELERNPPNLIQSKMLPELQADSTSTQKAQARRRITRLKKSYGLFTFVAPYVDFVFFTREIEMKLNFTKKITGR
jgi:hypothetical protein